MKEKKIIKNAEKKWKKVQIDQRREWMKGKKIFGQKEWMKWAKEREMAYIQQMEEWIKGW